MYVAKVHFLKMLHDLLDRERGNFNLPVLRSVIRKCEKLICLIIIEVDIIASVLLTILFQLICYDYLMKMCLGQMEDFFFSLKVSIVYDVTFSVFYCSFLFLD